ncbi:phospholipase D1-like [Macrosteles quadrilineatus]|uniref:phospholipase D1-like n=1 Tax=Macrosteles quadrilineatus TaxID=74068 RepID=UPI0023E1DFCD|nr:phospholipase D1-like [Macrosteles quadrilineatus]
MANVTGPPSLDSEYDEYLAIPDIDDDGTPYTVTDGLGGKCDLDDIPLGSRALPFKNVHLPPIKFKSPHRRIFISNEEIELQFTDYERSVTTHLLNPNLYTIELRHGDFTWTLKKRYKHFHQLHQQLRLFRASLNIPFPTKTHKERRESAKHIATHSKGGTSGSLPRFPSKPDALVPDEQIENRMRQLEEYLRNLLKIPLYRDHHETTNFLEVSQLSFVAGLGLKGKEGEILKRTRSAQPGARGCNCCGLLNNGCCVRCNYLCSDVCGSWRRRWLVVKDSFIAYIRPRDGSVKCVILYDTNFEVSSGIFSTGLRRGLHIINLSRHIVIKCPTRRTTQEWMAYIRENAHNSDFIRSNRYHSYAPYRIETMASWFVDGCDYMSAVADAMERAREEIFIADWWLSPEIYMKRPAIEGDYWRLDKILQRKASQGVKVFVLLYKEVELALGINSYYSKQRIVSSHPANIKVLRHPDHAKAGVFLWAHHEKIVVVDQSVAFLGGIDLCYGRWDTHEHRLTDLGSVSSAVRNGLHRISTSSHQYKTSAPTLLHLARVTNSLGVGLATVPEVLTDNSTELQDVPLTPTDEVDAEGFQTANGNLLNQPSPENMKADTPELERKNVFDRVKDNVKSLLSFDSESESEEEKDKEKVNEGSPDVPVEETALPEIVANSENIYSGGEAQEIVDTSKNSMKGLFGNAKYWIGKDYTNFIVKDFNNLDRPYQDLVDRSHTPRMPWHDVGAMVHGAAARDVARHFIMRWNAVKLEKAKLNPMYPNLIPKTYRDVELTPIMQLPDVKLYRVKAQIVRSVSHWSAGFMDQETWEGSIHEAYVDIISKAKRYVYIENQFFITLASLQVRNQIGDALFKRILRAHREKTQFRVFVVMPLLPGFEGEVGSPSGSALHAITHWNYASINRGKDSLMVRLKEAGVPDPSEFITFHGLRTHSELNGELVTELIYVHSKLLIADDTTAICGSANINDRSLLGSRDSEVAVVIQDEEFEEVTMGEETVKVGFYCGELRQRLFKEHLGLLSPGSSSVDLSDPVSPQFYHDVWRTTAKTNTEIFEKVFNCIPSDEVTNFQTLRLYQDKMPLHCTDPSFAEKLMQDIKGHLVMLPLNFLRDEILTPNPSSVNGMMPTTLWT